MKIESQPTILAIETSCDETAVAVVRGRHVLANAIYSQLELHKQFGGVVPHIAKLAHQEKFDEILNIALDRAQMSLEQISAVGVTVGPGLAVALEVGVARAKDLAARLGVPLVAVNHMEGHLMSVLAELEEEPKFPAIALLVSGGHSEFHLVKEVGNYAKLGQTVDDACGEAFDKAATMLGLEYPGGPIIDRLASEGRKLVEFELKREHMSLYLEAVLRVGSERFRLPIPMAFSEDCNVSFSGLKTAFKQMVNELSGSHIKTDIKRTGEQVNLTQAQKQILSALYVEAAYTMLMLKLELAIKAQPDVRELWGGGGVMASEYLVQKLAGLAKSHNLTLRVPLGRELMTDNAAMVGIVAGEILATNRSGQIYIDPADFPKVDRLPNWELT